MKHIILIVALLITVCSTSFAQTAKSPSQSKHPVETFFMSGIAAFNAHNLDEFMKQFADELEMYTPTGWLRGKNAVRERFVETFKQFPMVKMEIEDLRVREIKSDVVLVDFKWHTFPMGTGPAFHGVGSGVYILRDGKWGEVLEHETVVKIDEGIGRGSK
jgi:hypothetical protein